MKNIITPLLFLFAAVSVSACDFCNCYLGLNPHYKKNTFGIRYHSMYYEGTHLTDAQLQHYGLTKSDFTESRTQVELHGQVYPMQKLQVTYSVPYAISHEHQLKAANHHHGN
jgi:hypothetical protein